MSQRASHLLNCRPTITAAKVLENTTVQEQFQNNTLRPVIKLQNNVLIVSFQKYIIRTKNTFYKLSLEERMLFIEKALQKDMRYRNLMVGVIIGLLTLEEFEYYYEHSATLNKRIISMLVKRLQDQIQIFDQPT